MSASEITSKIKFMPFSSSQFILVASQVVACYIINVLECTKINFISNQYMKTFDFKKNDFQNHRGRSCSTPDLSSNETN